MEMTKKEAIRSYVEQLSRSDLANLLQCINRYDGCFEEETCYDMDEFDEVLFGHTPMEIAQMIHFGEFNLNDDYFRFDVYGNLESLSGREFSDEAERLESDIINRLVNHYNGDTPWADLDYLVHADDNKVFNEDFEEVEEDEFD